MENTWIENWIGAFRRATADELTFGIGWYAEARLFAKNLAQRLGLAYEVVVACLAVNSPANSWKAEEKYSEYQIRYLMGDGPIKCCNIKDCRGKCGGIRCEGPGLGKAKMRSLLKAGKAGITKYVKGQKVENFYANIMGDESITTIDYWMVPRCTESVLALRRLRVVGKTVPSDGRCLPDSSTDGWCVA